MTKHQAVSDDESTTSVLQRAIGSIPKIASARGGVQITTVVVNQGLEATSEFEAAEEIRRQLESITEPHLMVSVLQAVNQRMQKIRAARDGGST